MEKRGSIFDGPVTLPDGRIIELLDDWPEEARRHDREGWSLGAQGTRRGRRVGPSWGRGDTARGWLRCQAVPYGSERRPLKKSATMAWAAPVSDAEAARRAGGRRCRNALRQLRAAVRRQWVAELWLAYGGEHGCQAAIARELGVSRSTVCRDVAALFEEARKGDVCPFCGARCPPGGRAGTPRRIAGSRSCLSYGKLTV